jgi:hypothetical protein
MHHALERNAVVVIEELAIMGLAIGLQRMPEHFKIHRFHGLFLIIESNGSHTIDQIIKDLGQQLLGDVVLIESPDQTERFGHGEVQCLIFFS